MKPRITTTPQVLINEILGSIAWRHLAIASQLLTLAQTGDLRAIREVIDRLDGSPRQSVVTMTEPFTFGKITL